MNTTGVRSRLCLAVLLCAMSAGATDPGDLLWARQIMGVYGNGAAAFPDGSWCVTGQLEGSAVLGAGETNETTLVSAGGADMFVARYNRDATLAWARRAGGTASDVGLGLAAFPDGSLVVAGPFGGTAEFGTGEAHVTTLISAGDADIFVARYNPDGTLAWARRAGGAYSDQAHAVGAFPDGSSVITGYVRGSAVFGTGESNATTLTSTGYSNIFVARYNPDGTLAWARQEGGSYQGASSPTDVGRGVAAFADGSSVVTGDFLGSVESGGAVLFGAGEPNATTLSSGKSGAIFVARYNPDGTLAWARAAGGESIYEADSGFAVAALPDGSSIVAGNFRGLAVFGSGESHETTLGSGRGNHDIFVARYRQDGTLAWARWAGGDGYDEAFAVSSLPDGSSVVAGRFFTDDFTGPAVFGPGEPNEATLASTGHLDILVARYNPDGTLAWVRQAGGTGPDSGHGVAALPDESVVVTGDFVGPGVFGPGESNETTLSDGRGFIARYAGVVGITAPEAIVRECDDGADGATVNFVFDVTVGTADLLRVRDATGNRMLREVPDAADGTYGVGPFTFPHGGSTVVIELLDDGTVIASASVAVQVADTVAPVLSGCGPRTIELEGPFTTLSMPILGITVADACDPSPSVTFVPGALAPGTTEVTVTARDATGNARSCGFSVTVEDTTPPVFLVCPDDIEKECQGADGALVAFDVLATDLSGSAPVSCADEDGREVSPSGTSFAVGAHTVACTATDPSGNTTKCSFRVTVVDIVAPVILCPDDITVGTAPGVAYAFVEFTVTATDACDPDVEILCTDPWGGAVQSGDAFHVGSTTVTCTARDHAGNIATCSFNVRVEDREPPALSAPATAALVTDCAGSPLLVTPSSLGVTATDNSDPEVTLVLAPASVGPGTTEVTCTATDDDGNTSSATVEVTVLKGPFEWQFLRPLDGNVDNLIRPGQTVPLKLKVTCDNVFEPGATAAIESTVCVDAHGTPIANETVDDSGLADDGGSVLRLEDGYYAFNLSTKGWSAAPGLRFRVVVRVTMPGHADTLSEIMLKNR